MLEDHLHGRCTIFGFEAERNASGETRMRRVLRACDVPCHLYPAGQSPADGGALDHVFRLILPPKTPVRAGDALEITQHNASRVLDQAGEPLYYPTHIQLTLRLRAHA